MAKGLVIRKPAAAGWTEEGAVYNDTIQTIRAEHGVIFGKKPATGKADIRKKDI